VLSRAEERPCAPGHRARPRNLARLCRGYERNYRGHQPLRPPGRGLYHQTADRKRAATTGRCSMSTAPLRVLVIDDEPPIRKLLRVGLSVHGYHIVEASSGKTALELLGEQPPDLIILDLGLPDMRGHELLRTLRVRNDRVPIVVLSSRDDEAGKVQALDSGAEDYVTKPFGMDELLA